MPEDWHWRDREQPPSGGRAVVVDVDGVLSDASGRQHFLAGPGRKDWKGFFDAAGEDTVVDEVARLTELLDPALAVVLLTARPLRIRPATIEWLARHGIRWDLLIMRPDRDFTPSVEMKRQAVGDLRAAGFELRLAFEDDRRNVAMFHEEGVPCVYLHSGYYEEPS